jgi:hypothetical protein
MIELAGENGAQFRAGAITRASREPRRTKRVKLAAGMNMGKRKKEQNRE